MSFPKTEEEEKEEEEAASLARRNEKSHVRSRLTRLELQELFAVAWRVVGVGVVDVAVVTRDNGGGGGDDVRGSLACCDLRIGYWHRWNRPFE